MNLKDSKTKINLMRSFAGESQARNRYNISASVAKEQGLYIIQQVFDYTANQEKEHAEVFYNFLKECGGTNIDIEGGYPVDIYDTTAKILRAAEHNEREESDKVYIDFANVAKEEGFTNISKVFENIAKIENVHGNRFASYAEELESGTLFKKNTDVTWMCTNCGFIIEGKEAPAACPVCKHPQGYFILYANSMFE